MDIGQIQNPFARMEGPGNAPESGGIGNFAGQAIQVTDAVSLVADSAEEAGFAMSEREEMRLSERKLKPGGPDLDRLEQVQKYFELMDKQGRKDQLEKFTRALSGKKGQSPGDVLKEALKFFKDPADAYAALAYAGKALGQPLDKGTFAEAMDRLEDLEGNGIHTRLVAGVTALEFSGLGDGDGLKDLYARTVMDLGSPNQVYERILKDYGMERFEEALDFLTRTLGKDMAATTASTDKVQLSLISRDLGVVRQLYGLNAQCCDLHKKLGNICKGTIPLSVPQLVQEVLKLRDARFIGAFDIESIAGKAGFETIEERIRFFQDFSIMARNLSETLFADDNARLALIEAVQNALDDAIGVEEQMYEDSTPGQTGRAKE